MCPLILRKTKWGPACAEMANSMTKKTEIETLLDIGLVQNI